MPKTKGAFAPVWSSHKSPSHICKGQQDLSFPQDCTRTGGFDRVLCSRALDSLVQTWPMGPEPPLPGADLLELSLGKSHCKSLIFTVMKGKAPGAGTSLFPSSECSEGRRLLLCTTDPRRKQKEFFFQCYLRVAAVQLDSLLYYA